MQTRDLARVAARAGAFVLAALAVVPATTAAQGWHEDDVYGFKLMPPRGWTPIPLRADESWLVAKYLCDERDHWNDEHFGWTWEHQAELMVIAFVDEAIERAKAEVEAAEERARARKEKEEAEKREKGELPPAEEGAGKESGEEEQLDILVARPYENYEDYLGRVHDGRIVVEEREEDTVDGMPVTRLEVLVPAEPFRGPKRIVAWVFHAEGVDLAVQFEMIDDAYSKHRSSVRRTLRSFKTIERSGPLPTGASAQGSLFVGLSAMNEGTAEERREKRLESERLLHEQARASMPPGWQVLEHERFLVLHATDASFAKDVAQHSAAFLEWVEEQLGFIGPEEYTRRPVLRVCNTSEEAASLRRGVQGSDSWSARRGLEVVTCKDEYGASGWQLDSLNRSLLDLWLRDRDDQLWVGMPVWLKHGLYEYAEGARLRGRKLEFEDYRDQRDDFRTAVQQKKNIPVRELVQMTSDAFYGRDSSWAGYWDRQAQADMLVRFLLSRDAGRSKQTRTLLVDYLGCLGEVVREIEEGERAEDGEGPRSEEEEAERYKERYEEWGKTERQEQVLERTFRRVFAGWEGKEWEGFERAFLRFAG